ncbi:MAG: hypothetical protein R2751_08725 [Bacteroidales bacterium]
MTKSVVFPGWGLTRLHGSPHWIKGIASYACLSGAIACNRLSLRSFERMEAADSNIDAQSLFKASVRQDRLSEGLAYAAAGIWAVDFVWTWLGSSSPALSLAGASGTSIELGPSVEPVGGALLLCLRCSF